MNTAQLKLNAVDRLFHAFSDRTRVRVLHLLHGREMCVGDLVKALRLPQPKVSQHLAVLKEAGLAQCRKQGLWCHYSLAPAASDFHRRLLDCVACCFAEVPELKADAARRDRLLSRGGCCPTDGGDCAPAEGVTG